MDELKLLVETVANLPHIMVWVLCGYLVYKIAVIGSIYGLIRFGIEKLHSAYIERKKPQIAPAEIGLLLDGVPFDSASTKSALLTQLHRLQFIGNANEAPSYSIHKEYGVKKLRDAIDIMCERDAKK